ncbi:hypothetical protein CFOL_v3_05551 [Cephalotus follicularis]|uniref:Uncharacterized protein n=1 Tax=Cephalotus follicularis TaxID=3775 RepID=A0A1Q3B1Y9_CEPFO|nr:hypothetical protein CFOL_v3_05551 [Cephalotus follicularis]
MAFSHSKIHGVPLTAVKVLPIRQPTPLVITTYRVPSLQVNCKEEHKLRSLKIFNVSRRDTMKYLTVGALSWFALLSTEPAEARVGRAEMKRKIMQKLKMLKEKARVSEPKNEIGIKTPPAPAIAPPPPKKEKKLENPVRPLVEATLP